MHPVLFRIGGFPVYSYGAMLFVALVAGVFVAGREFTRKGLDRAPLYTLVAVIAIAGLVGSRVFFVLGHLSEFSGRWSAVFDINTVGLVYYGGLVFAFPAALLTVKWLKIPSETAAAAAGLALPLSLGIARIGCFLNGCCGGKPTGLPWAVTFPGTAAGVHPTQLYEALLDLALFAFLLLVGTRMLEGWDLLLASLAGYSLIRFFMEFFRQHSDARAGLFFQLFSAAIFGVCTAVLLVRRRGRESRAPADT